MEDPRFQRLLELRREAAQIERDLGLELDYYQIPNTLDPLGPVTHRLLCELGRDMIGIHDKNGFFKFVSGNCTMLFGWRPEEIIGRHPEDFMVEYEEAQDDHDHLSLNYKFRCGDGSTRWVKTFIREAHTPDESTIITITQDLHEEHCALETLKKYVS